MFRWVSLLFALLLGLAIGFAVWGGPTEQQPSDEPDDWLARVGSEFITAEDFVAEMERRGGQRPGQYQSVDQRRVLLNEMIIRQSLVAAARREGFDERPEVRRALDSVLINRYQQSQLEPLRADVQVSQEEVRSYYEIRAEDYSVPARKRIAMIRISVPEDADQQRRDLARTRADEALQAVAELELEVPHFGDVARRFSDDQASRYRGGVIGWVSEQETRPRFEPAVVEAAASLQQPGDTTGVIEGDQGFYIVRLVQFEPRQERSLERLAGGIAQQLRREKIRMREREFLDALLARAEPEINQDLLARIEPLSEPGTERTGPPAGPTNQEEGS